MANKILITGEDEKVILDIGNTPTVKPPPLIPEHKTFFPSTVERDGKMYRATLSRKRPKIGRNEPCPCGSGQKYKKCCMNKKETK